MRAISDIDIQRRIERDNPWWVNSVWTIPEATSPRRVYFEPFKQLALNFSVRRAAILLGPRRVGKTFMIKQLLHEAMIAGIEPSNVLYASIDTPVYSGISLEKFLSLMPAKNGQKLVVFDEIQYLKDWEIDLKDLVDSYKDVKFVATGSAAAALRLKSQESGAGRFSEFMLPPLTFYEFLVFLGEDDALIERRERSERLPGVALHYFAPVDIQKLNARFVDYLNFGGYPEAVINTAIRNNPEQFIRNDIIDKVLLKDLPSLYGIEEIQELNKLFSFLAYNAGHEANLENISQGSGLAKPTIKKYIEYLEKAFLIIKVSHVDENCKSLQRERNFKIYLNNPSMRAALFGPVYEEDTDAICHLAESAIYSQWQHAINFRQLRYARWKNEGEVDIVMLSSHSQRPDWIGEVKWSDRYNSRPYDQYKHLQFMLKKHKNVRSAFLTTKTISDEIVLEGVKLRIIPSSVYCYTVGRNITDQLDSNTPGQT
ncbi:ATP-binding protein [Methylobacterium sp. SyP6R]|uniref:ATP-binding protein n=1 Tax=Methylobacterium sp. SyP6R TaxID=2718876 RepID=UPI001F23E631|nr:ATP-binding protein [Methylobacterium sp. SyP6R]MCF4123811.1 ATP-binding protein [Methylobacterium sp. SyP6R]